MQTTSVAFRIKQARNKKKRKEKKRKERDATLVEFCF
jgi:hypothetical protein